MITIYTDGGCHPNPGPGGYGIVLMQREHRKELSQGFKLTTNNRMELLAVIVALESLKVDNQKVEIYSDSKYVVDSIEKRWVFGWAKKNFVKKDRSITVPYKNIDLWKRFLLIYPKNRIKLKWIKGHNDNIHNERCDYLASISFKGDNLITDSGYISSLEDKNLNEELSFE